MSDVIILVVSVVAKTPVIKASHFGVVLHTDATVVAVVHTIVICVIVFRLVAFILSMVGIVLLMGVVDLQIIVDL